MKDLNWVPTFSDAHGGCMAPIGRGPILLALSRRALQNCFKKKKSFMLVFRKSVNKHHEHFRMTLALQGVATSGRPCWECCMRRKCVSCPVSQGFLCLRVLLLERSRAFNHAICTTMRVISATCVCVHWLLIISNINNLYKWCLAKMLLSLWLVSMPSKIHPEIPTRSGAV